MIKNWFCWLLLLLFPKIHPLSPVALPLSLWDCSWPCILVRNPQGYLSSPACPCWDWSAAIGSHPLPCQSPLHGCSSLGPIFPLLGSPVASRQSHPLLVLPGLLSSTWWCAQGSLHLPPLLLPSSLLLLSHSSPWLQLPSLCLPSCQPLNLLSLQTQLSFCPIRTVGWGLWGGLLIASVHL